jgi:hypothetical protein
MASSWTLRLAVIGVWALVLLAFKMPTSHGDLPERCFGNLTGFECTFTNTSIFPRWECLHGELKHLGTGGRTVSSNPLCSGTVGAHETKTVHVPWLVGKPVEACFKDDTGPQLLENSALGQAAARARAHEARELDWDGCELHVQPE